MGGNAEGVRYLRYLLLNNCLIINDFCSFMLNCGIDLVSRHSIFILKKSKVAYMLKYFIVQKIIKSKV